MTKHNFDSTELPSLPSNTQCVLIARDPHWIYAYWNYKQEDLDNARHQLHFAGENSQLVLRVYDVTLVNFNGSNANHSWDLDVGFSSKNWYAHVWQDNATYCTELGIRSSENHFIPLTRSNIVHTPPKSTSKRDDLIWKDIKDHKESQPYIQESIQETSGSNLKGMPLKAKQKQVQSNPKKRRTYSLTAGDIRAYYKKLFSGLRPNKFKTGKYKLAGPSVEEILKRKQLGQSYSDILWEKARPFITMMDASKGGFGGASEGLSSFSSVGASEGRLNTREFFFEIWTELVVHGRTAPDATVWLNHHKEIKLNPDGTFSLRYTLPDGDIPLK
ncbi:MAG: DUF4912 domain-containing protein, partial [Candidatus Omnitrophica bacterium]|nr:DUF4912 domain-containing protein [Candidatus Omnitrophota bacterium]